ncbi:MAG: GTPase RsgA, partial [Frankiales bacterium]|nr:GTPase RsgA [Frankiales bacterium]
MLFYDTVLPHGTRLARVARVDRGAYDILTDAGPGRLAPLAEPERATVGDWLAVRADGSATLLPRTSLLSRASAAGTSRPQLLAANVDVVLVCASLATKVPVRRIERLLTLAWESGARPVLVLTKADLHPDPASAVRSLLPHAPGAAVVTVCASAGSIDALTPYAAAGSTLVLLGASGAGKSTVVNALAGTSVMGTG